MIDPRQREATGEIQVHLQIMLRVGRDHTGTGLDGKQGLVPHEPRHPPVIDAPATPPQFGRDPPIAIPPPMRHGDRLNLRSHRHLFVHGLRLLQGPIEARPADRRQLTHPLNPETALP